MRLYHYGTIRLEADRTIDTCFNQKGAYTLYVINEETWLYLIIIHYTIKSICAPNIITKPISNGFNKANFAQAKNVELFLKSFKTKGSRSLSLLIQKFWTSLRNFDLNDWPLFCNDSPCQRLYLCNQNTSAFGGSKLGDPIISITALKLKWIVEWVANGKLQMTSIWILEWIHMW